MRTLVPADDLGPLADALVAEQIALVPTDTVYGLAALARSEAACTRMLLAKTRDRTKPTQVIAPSADALFRNVLPGLDASLAERASRLLPGPVTLVLPNPARLYPWLCGPSPERIGVRVPVLVPALAAALERAGAVAATSANLAGGRDPASLDEVPGELRAIVAVAVDAGPIGYGAPSTVIDLTGTEPVILREGPVTEAAVRAALGS
jgi:L-threonylcarbamoyladenylate synthase